MANKNIVKGNIGNALHSVAPDHIVTTSDEVFDETLQMYQNEINFLDGVFDISAYNLTDGQPTKYADLAAALGTNGANVPDSYRRGGMSIKFIQSSDNKYMQFRYMSSSTADADFVNTANWQGVDDVPTSGSRNLVESVGTFEQIQAGDAVLQKMILTPSYYEEGYYVNNGVYTASTYQASEIFFVRKGTKLSVTLSSGVTLRYGYFSNKPKVGDTTTDYGSTTSPTYNITIENDAYLVLSHMIGGTISVTSVGLEVDAVPTDGSHNPVESNGVYDAIASVQAGVSEVNQGLNETIGRLNNALDWDGLSISYIKEVDVSGNLFKIAKKISDDGYYISSIKSDGTLEFSSGADSYRSYLIPVDGVSTYNFTYGRLVVLMQDETHAIDGASVQTYQNSVSSVGAKYIAFSFNSETHPESTYQVGIGSLQADPVFKIPFLNVNENNIKENAISTSKVQNNAVTIDKASFTHVSKNLFNINDPDNVLGKYISYNVLSNGNYNTTGYIPVEPNTTYQCSYDGDIMSAVYLARFVCQYGEDKSYISGADLQPIMQYQQFTTGENTYFVRVSVASDYWQKYQIEKGTIVTYWERYGKFISNDFIEKEGLAIEISPNVAKGVFQLNQGFKGFSDSADALAQNETLTLPLSYSRKEIAFTALINGTDSENLDVLVGLGHNAYRGGWLELTPTKLIVHEYDGTDNETEYNHGLTLGENAIVSYSADKTTAVIKIISDGVIFSQNITKGFYFGGAGFITNLGSNNVGAKITVIPKDITEKIWLLGDSYLSWNDSARWTYYMLEWGFDSWMSDSKPGGNSDEGYESISNDVNIGKPVYLLWAFGMNDGTDVNNTQPNYHWVNKCRNVISICTKLGIIPILATIPSVPNINHEGKNYFVRNSGLRYIDFAAAVGATSSGVWKTGMLAGDNVHPTQLGAKALASQVLIDFPEIMVLK